MEDLHATLPEPASHVAARKLHRRLSDAWFDRIDMAEHARDYGISATRLSASFREIFGCSPKQMQVELRMEAAKRALRDTNWSISDVSYECGFYDVVQLARMFRRALGMTPSSYRREAKAVPVNNDQEATLVRRLTGRGRELS
jgi:AraC-like DNA-binding protein